MEVANTDRSIHEAISQDSGVRREATSNDEIISLASPLEKQQKVIKDSRPMAVGTSRSDKGNAVSKGKKESTELTERMSRIETVRQDARKLKTTTLNKMGKMFKQRSQTPVLEKPPLNVNGSMNMTKSVENYSDETTKKDKEKSNSLGRMLKLVDKDGSPKKMFHPRTGSLSRILRRQPTNENIDEKKPPEDNSPGILSRMISQLRGRPHSGSQTTEPNIKTRGKMNSLPPKVPLNLRSRNLSSSTSPTQETESLKKLSNFEYSV